MKSVFIFGAGASRSDGGPLMSDFFDCAEHLLRNKRVEDARREFEDVFDAIAELQSVHSKSDFDLDNLEMLFGAIEMGQLIHKFGNRTPEQIANLRNSIVTLIVRTLEMNIGFPVNKDRRLAPQVYRQFVDMLTHVSTKTGNSDYSFITFNYDIALDYALLSGGIETSYLLAGDEVNHKLRPLLKLHGSINWGRCANCKEIQPIDLRPILNLIVNIRGPDFLCLSDMIRRTKHSRCDHMLTLPPVIVPPTWDKTSHHAQLANVWKNAAKELEAAERIFIIGYSLPDSDLFFRYLFSLGSMGKARIKTFMVVDPDKQDIVIPRFRKLIGRGIVDRFQPVNSDFAGSLSGISKELHKV